MKKLLLLILVLYASHTFGQAGYKLLPKYDSLTHQPRGLDTAKGMYFKNGTYTAGASPNSPDTITYTPGGSLPAEYVARGTGTSIYGDSSFTHDSTNRYVGMNSKIPVATLDIRAYYIGTVGATNGSAAVTGTGTSFTKDFKGFDSIYINGTGYRILSVSNATSLTLTTNFGQTTASGLSYYGQFRDYSAFAFYNNGVIGQGYDPLASPVGTPAPIFRTSTSGGNLGVGYRTLSASSSGAFLTGIGYGALRSITTGQNNTAVGYTALANLTTVAGNTAVGSTSLAALSSTGANNTAVGYLSLGVATSGSDNVAVGYNSLGSIASPGSQVVAIGRHALSNTSGNDNDAIGYFAGQADVAAANNASCSNSIFIGSSTKVSASGLTNQIVIGFGAIANGSNTTVIGNTSHTQANLYGDIQNPVVPPGAATLVGSTSGGSITAGTYRYRLTAVDASSNTSFYGTESAPVTTTGSTSSVTLTFPTLPAGAVSWNIYRTTTQGVYGASSLIASAQTGATYVDVAAATSSGTPAIVTTAFVNKISRASAGDSYINNGGGVGIGTNAPSAKAILDLTSTTKGLLLPRMTKTQRDAISSPPAGLAIYQTDNTPGLRVYNGTNWMKYTETTD